MPDFKLLQGDCREVLKTLPDNSVDAIVTDPPYGLEFMGKEWDAPWKSQDVRQPNDPNFTKTDNPYGRSKVRYGLGASYGGGFSKPGIGDRPTEWPSFTSTSKFGSVNPTCGKCGGRSRGSKKCECAEPEWKPIGKRRNPENEGLPDDVTSSGMATQMRAFQDWYYSVAVEMYRVLKPGGHILSFGGSRTYHRMACAIEDAGFEVRDQLMWVYGSGFPKSHNISKALDKAAGVEPKVLGRNPNSRENSKQDDNLYEAGTVGKTAHVTAPTSEEAKKWEGWGTALKPAHEPIVLARKPLDGTVVDNVRKWGVGGLNIDGCRVSAEGEDFSNVQDRKDLTGKLTNHHEGGNAEALEKLKTMGRFPANLLHDNSQEVLDLFPETGVSQGGKSGNGDAYEGGFGADHYGDEKPGYGDKGSAARYFGRFPANLMHDGSEDVVGLFPADAGAAAPVKSGHSGESNGIYNDYAQRGDDGATFYGDKGSAARFFYCAKASKKDRDEGCDHLETQEKPAHMRTGNGTGETSMTDGFQPTQRKNTHPTVKPTELMRYLCRLITPKGGVVLDPFNGSGSTGKAALKEGFDYIGIEMNPEYIKIAEARIRAAL